MTNEPGSEDRGVRTESPLLSILLVSYNSRRFLDDCIGSIRKWVSVPYEIVLVDNNSSDGTAEYVRDNFPAVRLVRSDSNLGFAGGNNRAADAAKGKYLLLLNCDTILQSDIAKGIHILESDSRVGIVGAAMYRSDGQLALSAGHFPRPWRLWKIGWLWSKPHTRAFGDPTLHAYRHDWVEGSFLLTTRANWFETGGMDEFAFMYVEDVEFCAHTLHLERVTVQCPDLKYTHFGGFNLARIPLLYAGFRRFHATCSSRAMRFRADTVMLLSLIVKVSVFGALRIVSRKRSYGESFLGYRDTLMRWKELAPKPQSRARAVAVPHRIWSQTA